MDIRYVRIPYTAIPDSTIIISKNEIAEYIKAHATEYKQERARDIQFVYFEEKPSLQDEAAIKEAVTALIEDKVTEAQDTTYVEMDSRIQRMWLPS